MTLFKPNKFRIELLAIGSVMEIAFMLVMSILVGSVLTGSVAALVLSGIRDRQWPVLQRRRVVYRGFVPR
ncbi:hypothetical protein [Nonomuraea sp. NPDC049480]|uniref:hypothetical protein n=1 Tax=Nonomuraea sp. NPDC049480 TaxID=3364353 RepID=UPI0037BCE92B